MSYGETLDLIRAGRSFLVTCHRRPDGDALGSALGLAAVLRVLGKEALVFTPDPIPRSLAFLPRVGEVVASLPPGVVFDATFITDTASPSLLPKGFPARDVSGPVIVLDHHAVFDDFGDVVVRDIDASATGEVVLRLMQHLGVTRVPADAAMPLYTAIVTDTGGFRYSSTTAALLRISADLIDAGAEPWTVARNVFEEWPRARVALLQDALASMRIELDGRLALLPITQAMLARAGADEEMAEGLVNYARRVEGVEVGALLLELPSTGAAASALKLSLRASRGVDVSRIAQSLGGGGHRAAAGATIVADLETACARLVATVERALAP